MSSFALPSIPLLKGITRCIDEADGAETYKELLPSILASLLAYLRSGHTDHSISEVIRKSRDRAKRLRGVLAKRETLIAEYNELQERLASRRMRPDRRAQLLTGNASLIRSYRQRKEIKEDARSKADQKLSAALIALKQRNRRRTEERAERVREAREEENERKAEEKRREEEKAEAQREEKQAIVEEKQARELDIRVRITDQRGLQLVDAKARKMDMEAQRVKDAELARKLHQEMREALALWSNSMRREQGLPERRAEANDIEYGDDQENRSPIVT